MRIGRIHGTEEWFSFERKNQSPTSSTVSVWDIPAFVSQRLWAFHPTFQGQMLSQLFNTGVRLFGSIVWTVWHTRVIYFHGFLESFRQSRSDFLRLRSAITWEPNTMVANIRNNFEGRSNYEIQIVIRNIIVYIWRISGSRRRCDCFSFFRGLIRNAIEV